MKSVLKVVLVLSLFLPASVSAQELSLGERLDPQIIRMKQKNGTAFSIDRHLATNQPSHRKRDNFGWYVGATIMSVRIDMNIFDPMTADRDIDSFSDRVLLGGPMGGIIWKDLRLGAMIITGEQHQSDLIDNKRRNAYIAFTGAALFIEYSHMIERRYPRRVPYLRVGYLVGGLAGTGEVTLEVSGLDVPDKRWEVTDSVPFASTYVGVWLSPFDWLWLQFDMGYLMTFWNTEDPKYEDDSGEPMVTRSPMGGLQIGIKVLIGENPNIYYEPPSF